MPDWRGLVRQRLTGIQLKEHEAAEVIEELADHLEDAYRSFLRKGLLEEECVQEVLREVSSWRDLRAEIESSRKREPAMNKRVSQFWFPAFLTLFLSQVALMLIQEFGPRDYLFAGGEPPTHASPERRVCRVACYSPSDRCARRISFRPRGRTRQVHIRRSHIPGTSVFGFGPDWLAASVNI